MYVFEFIMIKIKRSYYSKYLTIAYNTGSKRVLRQIVYEIKARVGITLLMRGKEQRYKRILYLDSI